MNIPGVRFLCQIILGETFEPLTLMLARRNPPLRSISVGNVLVASDFASLLSNGYVGERVIQAHQELLNRTTTRVHLNICDVINKLGARVHPPRRWAEMFTWLEVPPQQGQDCAVCVNDMFWRFAENPEQFLGSRDFWFDGVQLRIQQAKLLYDSCL